MKEGQAGLFEMEILEGSLHLIGLSKSDLLPLRLFSPNKQNIAKSRPFHCKWIILRPFYIHNALVLLYLSTIIIISILFI